MSVVPTRRPSTHCSSRRPAPGTVRVGDASTRHRHGGLPPAGNIRPTFLVPPIAIGVAALLTSRLALLFVFVCDFLVTYPITPTPARPTLSAVGTSSAQPRSRCSAARASTRRCSARDDALALLLAGCLRPRSARPSVCHGARDRHAARAEPGALLAHVVAVRHDERDRAAARVAALLAPRSSVHGEARARTRRRARPARARRAAARCRGLRWRRRWASCGLPAVARRRRVARQ